MSACECSVELNGKTQMNYSYQVYIQLDSIALRETLEVHQQVYSCDKHVERSSVGIPQSQQCLIHVGVELWMWNWRDLGQQLFYQLALLQSGGLRAATLKEQVDVTKIISFAMEIEVGMQ
jgi:hypothetical protein